MCAEIPASLPSAIQDEDAALDSGSLVSDSTRLSCHIRKFTSAGATLRLTEPAEEGAHYALELGNGQSIPGTINWAGEGEAGFVFDTPLDVVGTLARNLAILPAERRRVPRVELRQNVGIRHGDEFEFARTRDLSQAGVGIETRLDLREGDRVQVAFDGLNPLEGTVKWAQAGKAGVAFETELAWQTLMPWLRQAQKAPAQGAVRSFDETPRFGLAGDKQLIRLNTAARVREGSRWWNVQVRYLTPLAVQFECETPLAKGAQLWLWVPGFNGWPVSVSDVDGSHYLAEFRIPLRPHDLDTLVPARVAARSG